ncbi:MAG: MerR family DNA-binding transcriptional regulator [Promethearchaeota archaeon]
MDISIGKAAQLLEVCPKTLRRWDRTKILVPVRTLGNRMEISENEI